MQTDDCDVIVVGAGPVGLLLATLLARDGVSVALIDGMAQRAYFCKALGVTARTLEVLADVGIVQDAIDAGVWLTGVDVFDDGVKVHSVDVPAHGLPYGALSLAQFETERLLERTLNRHGNAVRYATTLTGFTDTGDGVLATVQHADGTTAAMRCRWLVGCDGAHSLVRSLLGFDFSGAKYPQTFVLADVDVTWELPRGRAYHFTSATDAARTPLAAIPIHGSPQRYRLSTVLPSTYDAGQTRATPDLDTIRAIMLPLLPPGTALDGMRWSSIYSVSHRIVSRYGQGRVLLAGDAAHIHPPVGGQGMNTGLQDAYNLAWKLTLAARNVASEGLLASYSAERHPVGLDVVEETSRALDEVLANKVHGAGMRETQLLVSYRGSVLMSGDVPHDAAWPAPGDRAPDAAGLRQRYVAQPAALRAWIGAGRHLLVGYAGPAGEGFDAFVVLRDVARRALGDGVTSLVIVAADGVAPDQERMPVVIDSAGEFAAAYGATPGTAWLVRPDGYIGWRSAVPTAEGLREHLARIVAP